MQTLKEGAESRTCMLRRQRRILRVGLRARGILLDFHAPLTASAIAYSIAPTDGITATDMEPAILISLATTNLSGAMRKKSKDLRRKEMDCQPRWRGMRCGCRSGRFRTRK